MVGCIGRKFLRSILKYGSSEFVQKRLILACVKEHMDRFIISVNPELYDDYYYRLISDIKQGHLSTAFDNKQICSGQFRKELLIHCQKHLKAKRIIDANDRSTVLHKVSSSGYTDLLAYFVKNDMPGIDKQDIDGKTALYLAVLHRHQHIVEILLRQNADVHFEDNDGRSVIHIACNNGDFHMVELLLKHKAHKNRKDKHGLTPLHLASIRGDTEVVKLLKQKKIKLNEIDDIGRTPLYVACEMNRVDTVKCLLQNLTGIAIHIEEKNKGFTPLHIACMQENTNIVETLLQYGANVNQPATDNTTPLKIAKRTGNEKLINLLNNHKGTCSAPK
ncbi:unnamed protein product [Mytilus coruscus]|uniref:Uncharacterized protein n=1 Tax=Mytilus coruscus TaxID=42192 RepID=A0A6J8BSU0_MYTCO|nr:unnamed protein product [Mytilus coruscus]